MLEILTEINQALAQSETVSLLTIIDTDKAEASSYLGQKRLLRAQAVIGSLGNQALDQAADREARYQANQRVDTITLWSEQFQSPDNAEFCQQVKAGAAPRLRLLIEQLRPQPCLLICGAGHIARALSQLGLVLGFRAIVIDDRAQFASREFFPDQRIELIAAPFAQAIGDLQITTDMAIVIVTRGHKHDEDCLRLLLRSPAHYLGMIGSRRRIQVVQEKLATEGFSQAERARIYAPIGLDIGARTPEEIALAILAEIILVRNRGASVIDCQPLSRTRQ